MSLLPSTSHANPTTPFWASSTGGGGGGVVPISFTVAPQSVTYTSTARFTLDTVATSPTTDGVFVVNICFNVATAGFTNEFKFWVTDTANVFEALTICDSVSPANYTNASLSFTTFYQSAVTLAPVITFDSEATATTGDPIVSFSYNVIFYPFVFPPP
jgi:hypothetical protein